ncbi:MAG TPA: hypothetical protein VF503_01235 [Sphingobium sp.]|uniref:hypothetical protein n=1 Tax=Sphingobium sp. TaxID=1912891 RepID=UPI002ED4509B
MTKQRDPGSIDEALAMIAGQVPGAWAALAQHVDKAESTVRKWGDKDAEGFDINLPAAIALDILYQQHGGDGRPLYDCYGHLVGVAMAKRFPDHFELMRRTAAIVKEFGEAEAALILAALPGADGDDRRDAKRELLDAYRHIENILPLLEQNPPEPHSRAPP